MLTINDENTRYFLPHRSPLLTDHEGDITVDERWTFKRHTHASQLDNWNIEMARYSAGGGFRVRIGANAVFDPALVCDTRTDRRWKTVGDCMIWLTEWYWRGDLARRCYARWMVIELNRNCVWPSSPRCWLAVSSSSTVGDFQPTWCPPVASVCLSDRPSRYCFCLLFLQ